MTWKRWIVTTGLIATLGTMGPVLGAQQEGETPAAQPDPQPKPPEPKPEPKPPEPKAEEKPAPAAEPVKPGFWGDHLALFLEAAWGNGSAHEVESSIQTTAASFALSKMELDDTTIGKIGVGWKLPAENGSFLISFTGHREESYTFRGEGFKKAVSGTLQTAATDFYNWWTVDVDNGHLTSTLAPPVWVDVPRLEPHCPAGDLRNPPGICGNNRVDPDEVNPATVPTTIYQTQVPDSVQNRLQTVDALYQRAFGGRTWSGDWSAGLRRLAYGGNVPASAWLSVAPTEEFGFTDGAGLRLLAFNQDTTGIGPTGSLGLQYHLLKRRLTFYGNARFAFLLEDLNVDSGNFFTIVRDGTTQLVALARLEKNTTKSTWNLGGELGARFRIVDGLNVTFAYNRTSYQDVILLPFSITIPANTGEISQGTVGLFGTKDLELDTMRLGISFQF